MGSTSKLQEAAPKSRMLYELPLTEADQTATKINIILYAHYFASGKCHVVQTVLRNTTTQQVVFSVCVEASTHQTTTRRGVRERQVKLFGIFGGKIRTFFVPSPIPAKTAARTQTNDFMLTLNPIFFSTPTPPETLHRGHSTLHIASSKKKHTHKDPPYSL